MKKIEILLVEDNADDAELALLAFEKGNIIKKSQIHVVRDGVEALDFLFCRGKFAKKVKPDLPAVVLLDLNLPKVNGLEVLKQIIRLIRQWNADIVLSPRPYDYHPDHRYTSILVQDAAFMVLIPMVVTDAPPLRRNPVFLYYEDGFRKPQPFSPDIAISVDDVWQKKLDAFEAEPSQFYEAQPKCWGGGIEVPTDPAERRKWLEKRRGAGPEPAVRQALAKWYGPEKAKAVRHAEAFELCEYGRRASEAELKKLFPFFE